MKIRTINKVLKVFIILLIGIAIGASVAYYLSTLDQHIVPIVQNYYQR